MQNNLKYVIFQSHTITNDACAISFKINHIIKRTHSERQLDKNCLEESVAYLKYFIHIKK